MSLAYYKPQKEQEENWLVYAVHVIICAGFSALGYRSNTLSPSQRAKIEADIRNARLCPDKLEPLGKVYK